ncbi:putative tyrosine/serine protein phosphatase [Aspergillus ruber CBS 135680]|uniref:Tyrosine specific protein phosphatases domain-containing protein n=1 Tax=Aspergillus ruber (strain CBS 135680) TaxID=1388766 RepID=A0A017SSD9_ASPRC|nr:uncharacterized protein EURHEDRAFT_445780 [Aspergillus ruber CBS 135680]EYE99494.1 hypothetical protein EURHEDRAFT_445780 [Aspergillus ruber CBS 135680]
MSDLSAADRPFDNIINFRDVGKSINGLTGRRILKEGVLFRSARLDDASERDKRRLSNELHISTVIDLRSVYFPLSPLNQATRTDQENRTEHRMAAQRRREQHPFPQPTQEHSASETGPDEQSNLMEDDYTHLDTLLGINRVLISLTGKAWERSLIWRLDWVNFFKVLGLSASGYRTEAVKIVVQEVMAPRGLIGLGQDTLDYSTSEIREMFDLLAGEHTPATDDTDNDENEKDGGEVLPLLLHCTQGKDRTGIIILLLLLLTHVPEDAISDDYVRSESELVVEAEERLKEIRAMGIPEEYIKCPAGFTGAIRGYLGERYGGVEGYLEIVGVGKETQNKIKERLLA